VLKIRHYAKPQNDIELLDETRDPSVIAKAMREAGDFLINYKPKEDE